MPSKHNVLVKLKEFYAKFYCPYADTAKESVLKTTIRYFTLGQKKTRKSSGWRTNFLRRAKKQKSGSF